MNSRADATALGTSMPLAMPAATADAKMHPVP
jgi:hypothetical protein